MRTSAEQHGISITIRTSRIKSYIFPDMCSVYNIMTALLEACKICSDYQETICKMIVLLHAIINTKPDKPNKPTKPLVRFCFTFIIYKTITRSHAANALISTLNIKVHYTIRVNFFRKIPQVRFDNFAMNSLT